MNAAKSFQTANKIRNIFHMAAVLQLTSQLWPKPERILDKAVYDYIVVGGGTAGCVVASRLLEIEDVSVLLIEAGGNPPLESSYPRYFPYVKQSASDWNFTSTSIAAMRYHRDRVAEIPQGKMLGGTSNLNYMIYGHGSVLDYTTWATIANDTSWLYEQILPLFRKNEKLIDAKLLQTRNIARYYGKKGNIKLRRFYNEDGAQYLNAFEEMGHKILLNINAHNPLGYSHCLFTCGKKTRQDTANSFLHRVKDNSRLHIMRNALVTKIHIDSNKNAVGVDIQTGENLIKILARGEIILSAGVFKTPQLLMLSGIGPEHHLKEHRINTIIDLPVGKNLQVSPAVISVFKMGEPNTIVKRSNPSKIEFPVLSGHVALHNHDFPDYVVRSVILDNAAVFLEFCVITLSYIDSVCDKLYKHLAGSQIYIVMNHLTYPKSRGKVQLDSNNMFDKPLIDLGFYSHRDDRNNHALFLKDFHRVLNTTFFRRVGARFVDPKLLDCGRLNMTSVRYWKCYSLALASSSHNYAGTCAIGSVVDSRLSVYGVKKLRVADASVIPNALSAPIVAAVVLVAEKVVDMIKHDRKQ